MDAKGLTIQPYMTPDPITLGPEESLMRALELMRLRNIHRIPVVRDGALVGLLVEGDLKRAEPSMLSDSQEHFNEVMEKTPVSRIMIRDPMTIGPNAPLLEVVETFYTTKYGGLPVIDDGKVVGIVTRNDMLRALIDVLRG